MDSVTQDSLDLTWDRLKKYRPDIMEESSYIRLSTLPDDRDSEAGTIYELYMADKIKSAYDNFYELLNENSYISSITSSEMRGQKFNLDEIKQVLEVNSLFLLFLFFSFLFSFLIFLN